MTAVGHLVCYAVGTVDMLSIFGSALGDTQFKQMTVIAAMSLILAVSVTSYAVKERVLISVKSAFQFSNPTYTSSKASNNNAAILTARQGLSKYWLSYSEPLLTYHHGLKLSAGLNFGPG